MKGVTLGRFILEDERRHPGGVELAEILVQVALAGKVFARELMGAALEGMLGTTGETNVQGEATKKLDIFGHETMLQVLGPLGLVAAVISEEAEEPSILADGPDANFIVCTDPLDGSSNSDINGPVGTIFGVYRRTTSGGRPQPADLLRRGKEQIAAGYIMYGPGTVFVYTTGRGLNGFTLDSGLGEFILSHKDMNCPESGKYYSGNLANAAEWHPNIRKYLDHLTSNNDAASRPHSLRYTGALVADIHRTILEGGVYIYPPDTKHTSGKLRLLYECAPLGFVLEQAGGAASTGRARMLDVKAETIHQRVPIAIGSRNEVALYDRFIREGA